MQGLTREGHTHEMKGRQAGSGTVRVDVSKKKRRGSGHLSRVPERERESNTFWPEQQSNSRQLQLNSGSTQVSTRPQLSTVSEHLSGCGFGHALLDRRMGREKGGSKEAVQGERNCNLVFCDETAETGVLPKF